jgi:putative heme-binding domain-containing protein
MFFAAFINRRAAVAGLIFACVLLGADEAIAELQQLRPVKQKKDQQKESSVDSGRQVFESRCAGCHGLDGRGTERGPDIATQQNAQRQTDAALRHTIQHGIPASGMPGFSTLSNTLTQSLVAYLRLLQGKAQSPTKPENAQRGEILFFGKARCAECHMISGKGGFMASDLLEFGRTHTAAEIRRVIASPSETGKRGALTVVKARDGQEVSGLVRNEDNFSLQLQTLDGGFRLLAKSEIESVRRAGPLMPADYGATLTAAELDDLVAFLMRVSGPRREKAKTDDFEE